MQLPSEHRARLSEEFAFLLSKMKESKDPFRKLYFFSGFYGEVNRILNLFWDRDLAILHTVLQDTHRQANSRLVQIASGADRAIGVPNWYFDALFTAAASLTKLISQPHSDRDLLDVIAQIAELGYITTGNGYYLLERGTIKLGQTYAIASPPPP